MSEFTTTRQKLRKLWEKVQQNTNNLNDVDNTETLPLLQESSNSQNLKKVLKIYDSGLFLSQVFRILFLLTLKDSCTIILLSLY